MTATFGYWPFDGGPGADSTEPEWVDMFQYMRSTGIINMAGSLSPTGDCAVLPESGLTVQITTGIAWMVGTFFIHTVDPFYQDITFNDDPDGYDRIDLITLRTDFDANTTAYTYLEGTPAASPVAPPIIQTVNYIWDLPLAQIYVANGATDITSMDITDERVRSVQDGGLVTLTSDGGDQGLVTSSLAPNLAIKGLTAGSGIILTSDSNSVSISASTESVCILGNSSNVSYTNGSSGNLAFDTEVLDPSGMHDTVTNNDRINILSGGIYEVKAWIRFSTNPSATNIIALSIHHYDTSLATDNVIGGVDIVPNNASSYAMSIGATALGRVEAGDYLYLSFSNVSGVTITVYSLAIASTVKQPRFSAIKLSD